MPITLPAPQSVHLSLYHHHHTTQHLLTNLPHTTHLPTTRPQNHTLSNMVLLMITPEPDLVPKKMLMERLLLDLTQ